MTHSLVTGRSMSSRGPTAADSSGSGRDGTWNNGPTGICHALIFDGVNDWGDVGDPPALEGMKALTFAACIKLDTLPINNYPVLGKAVSYRTLIDVKGGGHSLVPTTNNGWHTKGTTANFPSGTFASGKWHHVPGTYDGNHVSVYADGTLASTGTPRISGTVISSNKGVTFGKKTASSIDYFGDALDDARVYRGVLSPRGVNQQAETPRPTESYVDAYDANTTEAADDGTAVRNASRPPSRHLRPQKFISAIRNIASIISIEKSLVVNYPHVEIEGVKDLSLCSRPGSLLTFTDPVHQAIEITNYDPLPYTQGEIAAVGSD